MIPLHDLIIWIPKDDWDDFFLQNVSWKTTNFLGKKAFIFPKNSCIIYFQMLMGGRVYIPGSSRYVKNLPFCIILSGEKAQMLHIWKIQVYIYRYRSPDVFFSERFPFSGSIFYAPTTRHETEALKDEVRRALHKEEFSNSVMMMSQLPGE